MSSLSAGRNIRTALFIVFLMVSMTWSAGINDIVSKYESVSELSDNTVFGLNSGCDTITRTAGTPIYVDPINGSATWEGTVNCPKNSLSEAVSAAISGDEIILQSGNYHDNVTVNNLDNLVIRAADGANVVFDGTKSISDDMDATWGTADGAGIQTVTLSEPGWQLFLNYDEQVPARWPNAAFSDGSVFDRDNNWAHGTMSPRSINNTDNNGDGFPDVGCFAGEELYLDGNTWKCVDYGNGVMEDDSTCCGNHSGLVAAGINPVGAIATLNVASFRSYSRTVNTWDPITGSFTYDTVPNWKIKEHAYMLEGKRELIDVDGEWWFDNSNNELHYKTPAGLDANNLDMRVKTQPYAITVTNSDGVTIQGIDFFGTTINVNNCIGCSFTNSTLEYPSTSKRGLGIVGEDVNDRWATRFYRSTNTFVDQISLAYTDGTAIEFHGSAGQSNNNQINNSYFYHIDWSVTDLPGLMVSVFEGGRDFTFSNSTVHLTGASATLSLGDAPQIWYNEVWATGYLQSDGAVVQMMQEEQTDANIAYNWIHDTDKYGIRMDGPIGGSNNGRNATVHHNVLWNVSGALMVKGDYHEATNNTVFGGDGGKNHIIVLYENGAGNENSVIWNNAADSIAAHRGNDIWENPLQNGTDGSNWNGYTESYRQSLASGYGNSNCIVSNAQSLYCWGNNQYGNLGNGLHGTGVYSDQPVEITSFGTGLYPVEVATSAYHSCAILNDGTVSCWGSNNFGQLGDGTQTDKYVPTPTASLGGGVKAVDLALGGFHTCVLLDDGDVKCWGRNDYGQLGDNSQVAKYVPTSSTGFTGASKAIAIAAGYEYTCAIIIDGSVKCWGRNNLGQLGYGTHGQYSWSQNPYSISAFPNGLYAVDIDAGYAQTCAVLNDGRIMCWGQGSNGRLGTGNTALQNTPTFTASLGVDRYAKQVVQGGGHGCAIIDDGTVSCWGFGEPTGTGTTNDVLIPTTTDSLGVGRTAQALIAGSGHTCAILDDGTMACWGFGIDGKLGNGATSNHFSPVPVITSGVPRNWQVSDFLVDPDNRDFRPKWGSPLHQLGAGAYDADDTDPWTAGVSWSYSPMSNPISGCMDSIAINYNSNAVFSDGSCIYTTLSSSSSTLSLGVGMTMTPHTLTYETPFLADDKQTAASSGSVGAGTNIALDSNGAAHICSKTVTTDNLYYTTNASGSWQSATLDSSGNVGGDCFIILDSDDDIHITYRDDSNTNLKYATKALSNGIAASNWAISTMDNNGNVGNFGSMAVDANDRLHVAYYSAYDSCLKYATKDDGSTTWSREVVELAGTIGKFTSIALDSNGKPHITYRDTSNTNLKYAHKMGSSWVTATIDSTSISGSGTSLAIDSNDHLHVAYKTNSTEIAYMTNRSGSWVKTTLDANTTGNWGVNYINIMLDEGDDPHVVYSDMVDYDIFYMSNTRGIWERVHVAGDSISKTSDAAMDENGGIHVAYHIDGSFDDIGYAAVRSLAHVPTFEIEPALPTGLLFDADTGTISGTPSAILASTQHTVWANTTRTSAMTNISIEVDWAVNRDLIPSVDGANLGIHQAMPDISFNRPTPSFTTSTVDSSVNGANHVHAADMDGDGDLDIVSAAFTDNTISWYENDGAANPSWATHDVVTNANGVRTIYVADLDNDGDQDIVAGLFGGKAITWYENNGVANSWTTHTVDEQLTNNGGVVGVQVADLDADGYLDIIGAWEVDDEIKWYKNNGGGTSWTSSVVATPNGPHGLGVGDMDNDGDLDIVAALVYGDAIAWYSNDGNAVSWTAANIDTTLDTTRNLYIGDLDGDSDLDIVSASQGNNKLTWHENSNNAQSWNNNIISTSEQSVYGVHIADTDGDGDLDIVSAVEGDNTIAVWENDGAVDPTWTEMVVSSSANGARNAFVADIDGDDDLDIISALFSGNAVELYKTDWTNSPSASLTNADCGVSPDLPVGLTMEAGTCTITGTPTGLSANATYTIYANYSSSSVQLTTTVYLEVDWQVTASVDGLEVIKDDTISPITFNWTGWSSSLVNSSTIANHAGAAGFFNSVVTDSNGKLHIISYRDDAQEDLKYTTNESGSWQTTTIDSSQNVGQYCSVAIDSADGLHVSYHKNEGNDLKYAYKAAGSSSWSKVIVDGTGGKYTSIAIDSNDNPHIAYRDSTGPLAHATCTGNCLVSSASWSLSTVNAGINVEWSSIAIDSSDDIHIATYDATGDDLYYSTGSPGSWSNDNLIDISLSGGMTLDIAISPVTDEPGISYFNSHNDDLEYKVYDGSSWSTTVVHSTGSVGRYNSLAYDSQGSAHISYERNQADDLWYATDATGTWVTIGIYESLTSRTGLDSAIAIDLNDDIHIIHRNIDNSGDQTHETIQGHITASSARSPLSGVTCTFSPSLPAGLNVDTGTCTISGSPTSPQVNTTHTITVTSSTGLTYTGEFYLNVIDQTPVISYAGTPFTLTKDVAISTITPTNTGGAATSWSISPNLPTGLTFDTSTGEIIGTPSILQITPITYTVTATNTGGTDTTTISLSILDSIPSISYTQNDLTLTKGTAMGTVLPSNSGGEVSSWSVSPAFSNGLNFDTSTGEITGTPNSIQTRTQYTITAINSGGSSIAYVNITVNDIAPSISYPVSYLFTKGQTISLIYATNTGGTATSWEVSDLPSGLSIDSSAGYIWGTPQTVTPTTTYTVWANNSGGSSSTSITITVNDLPPGSFAYNPTDMLLTINQAMTPNTASPSGGSVTSWEISPNVPTGLNFGSSNGTIWGTPTALQINPITYTIWANNSGGSTSTTVTITINDVVPSISYSLNEIIETLGVSINPHSSPTNIGGAVTSWEISPDPGPHFHFNDFNGVISGTPGALLSRTQYTVYANNSGGTSIAYVNVTINDVIPGSFSYSPVDMDLTINQAMTPNTVSPGGGTVTSWEISPSVPSGLNFGSSNGTIWGTPTVLQTSAVTYTIWANNSGGSALTTVTITINDEIPIFNYSPHELTFTKGVAISPIISPINTGGTPTSYTISPNLLNIFHFNVNSGMIGGTPSTLLTRTQFTITATNSGGSSVAYINVTINDVIPGSFSYSPVDMDLTINQAMTPNTVSPGGGAVTSWEISEALPNGLNFGTSNGTIWGTPTSLMTLKTFTIWANNSGGSSSAMVNITINDEAPAISYSPDWFELTKDTAMSPTATPTNAGGAIPSIIIDMGGANDVGEFSSIAIDSYGFTHISYYDDTYQDLKYATDKSGSWATTTVHSTGDVGQWSSLAIDSNGAVHISYYDATNTNLWYATCTFSCADTSTPWIKGTIESSSGDVGEYTSIAIDSNDAVHISYYDATNTNLKYATCSPSCSSSGIYWSKITIESSSGDVGKYNSIAIDSNDALHISYRDSTNTNLKYATCSSTLCTSASSWTTSTIDSDGNVGSRTSIAIDSNDAVHISYYDFGNGDLKYATNQDGSWANTTVDSVGTVGRYTSIAIDSNDVVHISYYDATTKDLKYASNMQSSIQTGVGNVIKFIDRDAEVGRYSSIAVDSNGDVHISYYDAINGDLKYAALQGVNPWNVYGYSISPSLPEGLSFNFTSGEISGTPTTLSTNTTYTITATNSGGSSTTTITIVVNDEAPNGLVYSVENMSLIKNQAMTPNTATVNGVITSWEISPGLPTGLSFGSSNGTIWGTPTIVQLTPITYTVWANNTGGSVSATLNITIADDLAVFSYPNSPYTIVRGYNMSDITPTVTSGTIVSWEIYPSLPNGLSFSNGVISGKPTDNQSITTYTVYANNSGGSATATLQLTINEPTPNIDYNPDNYTMTNGSSYTITPILLGQAGETPPVIGYPDSWSISPSLPTGLDFGTNNGTVWGIPTALQITPTMYTITATNANGSSTTTINLTIIDIPPDTITYSPHDMILTKNELMTPNIPTISSDITSWETYPSNLPPGLNFGTNNGTIWGTPSIILVSPITYTIWANNSGGSSSTTVNITINDQIPSISYSPDDFIFTINDIISPSISPAVSGGTIVTWAINATLPAGVFFGTNNGTIYGTTTQLWPQHTYLITATNSGGTSSAYLNITVIDELPISVTYPQDNLTLTNNTISIYLPMNPQIVGSGTLVSWEINGTLPQGLTLNSNTGQISGIPTELFPTTAYTVWANNSGGSIEIHLNITVVDQVPTISYSPEILDLRNNTTSSDLPLVPSLIGPGVIISWEINATLPSGIMFGSNNGTFYGTPTELWPTTSYTVWANNTGGSDSAIVQITVVDEVPTDISFAKDDLNLTNNTVSPDLPMLPQIIGPGTITLWEISGAIPQGLIFDTNTGEISGIPTELWPTTAYTVWANNTGGSVAIDLNITVVDQVPTLNYAPNSITMTNNTLHPSLPLSPTLTGAGVITSWEINATLPSGILFGSNNGTLYGIPTELSPSVSYTIWANNTGGSTSAEIIIEVLDQVPTSFIYNPDPLILSNNTASTDLPLVPQLMGPGAILTWEINATLPSGIIFDSNTGEISGIATELWSTTAYTVWANNSGGSVEGYVNITVVDEVPQLSYSIDALILTNNTESNNLPLTPILTGAGVITSWEINETLPSGILFGSNNGTFYGIPTELWPTTSYTVWANNTGGSISVIVNITVVDEIPTSIIYLETDLNLTNNTASPDLPSIPQITGPGVITSWEINGTMPQGLIFNTNDGSILGMPTELWPTATYTIWANNTGGSVAIEINITVVDQLPTDFNYSPSNLTLTNNTAHPNLPLYPQLTGPGSITGWQINASLPAGLNFGNNNGTIWGIPTVLQLTPMPYTVWANNTGGSLSTIINITIIEVAPTLDYNPDDYNFTRGVLITDITPTYTPTNLIDTWEISPSLPNGLIFDNGIISGTSIVNSTRLEYTVWANNSGGSASATFNITIVEPTGSFAYMPAYYNLTRGLGFSPILPNYNGGAIENWSIYPQLPNGLIFDNGTISGTPTVNSTEVNYTVYANNSGGSVTALISITINEPVSSIIYVPNERNETRTFSMTPWLPQVTGGNVETWEIYPDLPLGLTFIDGVISGTPTVNSTRTNYTIWANNTGGSASTMINLTVVEPIVQLSYPSYELTLIRNVTMAPLIPQLTGGNAEIWEVYPELPLGINFTDGMIWGTPQVNSTRMMYTIWANNTGGSTNISLNITILEPSANIVYDPVNLILTRGEAMEPVAPEVDGGSIETWGISPELPEGLNFNNGLISGTPTVNMTITNFIIYGNNSGGSSVVGISITVLEPAPTITYQTESLVLTRGEEMPSALHAIFGGGAVASFTLEPALPDGLNFTNGTIFGTPTVNSTIVQYNISAINNGGSDYFLLNITIVEPEAILSSESNYYELTRGQDEMNLTINNTGGMVATWEIVPQLPAGLIFGNGTITGTPLVNSSLASYTIYANNTGGSDTLIINIRVLEPASNISYKQSKFTLINGQDTLLITPEVLGGSPETWEFEPELPDGIIFTNGVFSGIPQSNLTTTTFTIWANNSGGTSSATIELTIDQPFYVVRYPVTLLVLNVSENMQVLEPIYYFDDDQEPIWSISPDLPDGLTFVGGAISGVPTKAQNLSTYNVTVSGEMLPITFLLKIEILEEYVEPIIEPANNSSNSSTDIPTALIPEPEEEPEDIAYWLFPILLIVCLWLLAMIYNLRNKDDDEPTP